MGWDSEANDPLSLNLYTYCFNNPIIYVDFTRHYTSHLKERIDDGGTSGGGALLILYSISIIPEMPELSEIYIKPEIPGIPLLPTIIVGSYACAVYSIKRNAISEDKEASETLVDTKAQLPENTIDAGKKGSKQWNKAKKKIKEGKGKGINVKTNSQEEAEQLLKEARPSLEKKEPYSNDGKSGYEIHPAEPNVGINKPHIKWWDWSNGKADGANGHIHFD